MVNIRKQVRLKEQERVVLSRREQVGPNLIHADPGGRQARLMADGTCERGGPQIPSNSRKVGSRFWSPFNFRQTRLRGMAKLAKGCQTAGTWR